MTSSFTNHSNDILYHEIAQIFNECQLTATNHRRNCIALKKLQTRPYNETPANSNRPKRSSKLSNVSYNEDDEDRNTKNRHWESAFFVEFFQIVAKVLDIRKNDEVALRLVKFINAFCAFSNSAELSCVNAEEKGIHSRFMDNFIQCMLKGVEAKDKTVRYRICLLLAGCINAIDEMRSDLLDYFVQKLSERLFDKEAVVRIAAVQALSRLQLIENAQEVSIQNIFVELMQYDSSHEVRKAVLSVIDFNSETASAVIDRTHDVNATVRKFLFKKKMEQIDMKTLTVQQRETILRNGLLDRDETVKNACIEMIFDCWLPATGSNIIQFLESLDIVENPMVAEEALKGFFEKHPNLFRSFPDSYFESLTAETAFIMRVYCEFVGKTKGQDAVQELLPEVINFGRYLKRSFDTFLTKESNQQNISSATNEENEFILIQLFHIGKMLDFSDEVSRRFMICFLRDFIVDVDAPVSLIGDLSLFLFTLCTLQEEQIGIFCEIVVDLYEDECSTGCLTELTSQLSLQENFSESLQKSVKPTAENENAFMQKIKSLSLLKEYLSLIKSMDILKFPILSAIFNEIVIPSINSQFAAIQELGLECLGQFILLYKPLLNEYVDLLVDFSSLGHSEIKIIAIKILIDSLMFYGKEHFNDIDSGSEKLVSLSNCFKVALCDDSNEELQCVAVEGCAKLMLCKVIEDKSILEGLMLLYFHPSSIIRPRIRQCLCFFFPAFAFGSFQNQLMFIPLITPVLESVCAFQSETPKDLSDTVIKPLQAAEQIFYWLNCQESKSSLESNSINIHSLIAIELLLHCLQDKGGNVKFFVQLLNKLKIDSNCEAKSIKKIDYLVSHMLKSNTDKAVRNSLRKFVASFIEFDDRTVTLSDSEIEEIKGYIK